MHQPTVEYWAKHYLLKDKGCILCGNFGILDTTGVRTIEGELIGQQTLCFCPNGQHLREQIKNIKSGENYETQTCSTQSQGNRSQHKSASIFVAHV